MRKFKTTLISLALIFAISSSAFANGLSLNSIGTKALGMGGAFVGLASGEVGVYILENGNKVGRLKLVKRVVLLNYNASLM